MNDAPPVITLFMQDLAGGGAERVCVNLANEFVARGIATDLLLVRESGAYRGALSDRVRIVRLGARKTLFSIPGLARYLRSERPTALLSFQTHVNVAAVAASLLARVHTRVVVTEHVSASSGARLHPVPSVRAAYRLAPWFYRRAAAVVGVSGGVAEEWRRLAKLPASRVLKIYNPVFQPEILTRAREPSTEPWLDRGDAPVIVFAGRLEAQKDVPTLLRAFAEARRSRRCRLVLLGEGPEEASIRALARELGVDADVKLVGFQANPYAFFSRAHVVALSSTWEGFGNVLVEALACGAHIVSTDCPHGPREVLEGGRWGRLVPVGDPPAFAAALREVLMQPRPGDAQIARAEVFGVGRVADEYLRVLLPNGSNGPLDS